MSAEKRNSLLLCIPLTRFNMVYITVGFGAITEGMQSAVVRLMPGGDGAGL